jgi:hypothetical protein
MADDAAMDNAAADEPVVMTPLGVLASDNRPALEEQQTRSVSSASVRDKEDRLALDKNRRVLEISASNSIPASGEQQTRGGPWQAKEEDPGGDGQGKTNLWCLCCDLS